MIFRLLPVFLISIILLSTGLLMWLDYQDEKDRGDCKGMSKTCEKCEQAGGIFISGWSDSCVFSPNK